MKKKSKHLGPLTRPKNTSVAVPWPQEPPNPYTVEGGLELNRLLAQSLVSKTPVKGRGANVITILIGLWFALPLPVILVVNLPPVAKGVGWDTLLSYGIPATLFFVLGSMMIYQPRKNNN